MSALFGTYECKIDGKGRLMLPAQLKKTLEPVLIQGFIIKKSTYHPCLELYPANEWENIMTRVKNIDLFAKEAIDFLRKFTAGYRTVEPDNIGRLQIPKDLVLFSGIKKELVLAGYVQMLEIWDKRKYDKVLSDATTDYAQLRNMVFGSQSRSAQ